MRQLAGESKATAAQLAGARKEVARMLGVLESARSWPKPLPTYVPYTSRPPIIDGKLDDVLWANAVTYEGAYPMNSAVATKNPNTIWRMLWDKQYLYIAIECEDADVIAPALKRNDKIYNYDCVEVFLLPDMATRAYWEIEVSPTGSLYEGLNVKHPAHWGSDINLDVDVKGMKVAYSVDGTPNVADKDKKEKDKGYIVELAIPFNQLPGAAADKEAKIGDTLWFTMARMDRNAHDDFTAYSFLPMLSWTHNIWNYDQMVLIQ